MCEAQTTAGRPALSQTVLAHESVSGQVQAESRMLTADSYSHDPFGRRLWKDVGGMRTYFMYADEGLIAEFDGTGLETKSYGYAPNSTWTTNPMFMKEGSQHYFYHNDHLGTPQKMTSVTGAVVWSAKYESFGKAEIAPSSTVQNNLRFPGQYYDQETGLYHRDFSPALGRYISEDPLGYEEGANTYVYAYNNGCRYIDPHGLEAECQRTSEWQVHPLIMHPASKKPCIVTDTYFVDTYILKGEPTNMAPIPGKNVPRGAGTAKLFYSCRYTFAHTNKITEYECMWPATAQFRCCDTQTGKSWTENRKGTAICQGTKSEEIRGLGEDEIYELTYYPCLPFKTIRRPR